MDFWNRILASSMIFRSSITETAALLRYYLDAESIEISSITEETVHVDVFYVFMGPKKLKHSYDFQNDAILNA